MDRRISIIRFVITVLSFLGAITSNAQVKIPAFPGAEGHARYITGGRGGEIRHVTNLNDSGSGSLREALKGNNAKTIVFDVSGYIDLQSQLDITSNTTIAGQTAPSPGITLRYYTVYFGKCDNVIVRYIRFRRSQVKDVNDGADATWGRRRNQIMLDHCSFSWSIDEVASFYDNNNFTMQWCTVGEAQNDAGHGKGNHGYGGIWGGKLASFHHNLLIHLNNRVPRFNGARYNWGDYTKNMYYDQYKWENSIQAETVDLRNCVMYNWGNGNGCYGGPGGGYINIVNNYYKAGPGTKNTKTVTQVSVGASGNSTEGDQIGMTSRYYISGNYVTAAGDIAANYDWKGVTIDTGTFAIDGEKYSKDPKHFYGDTVIYKKNANGEDCVRIKVDGPCPIGDITTHSAETTYEKVLAYAGASLYRDAVDARFMEETKQGTITYIGTKTGIKGIVDIINNPVGIQDESCPSFPQLISQSRPNGYDSDGDGIPDTWEIANGLSPYNASDANNYTIDKSKGWYTNLEVYMNALVENIMKAENADAESSINEYYPVCIHTESETVVITAKSYSREYGEPNPSFGYFKEGSNINGTPNIYCEATVSSPVGTYPIKISKGSITNSSVEYIDGTLTITKASLTVTANSYTRAEGEDNPSFGVTYSGFKNGETETVLTRNPTVTTSATTSSGPGTYDINVSGAEAQNYTFNYIKGTLTITETMDVGKVFEFGGIYYKVDGDNVSVTSSDSKYQGEIVIPSQVTFKGKTYSIKSIGSGAFYYCTELASITIPDCVTSIGEHAFEGCNGLTSVTIPNSVTSIGYCAFNNCSGLTSVTIPNSVATIGYQAFSGCSGLTSVTIPSSVTSIGEKAFEACSGLTSVAIPNSVTFIGYGVFGYCSNLSSVTIPNSVTSIGSHAFMFCTGLTTVTIPNSVTSIGNLAFYGCIGFTSVTIPNSVTSIGHQAFQECRDLTSVTIPNSVSSIGHSAFEGTAWINNQPDGLIYAGKVAYQYKGEMPANTHINIMDGSFGIAGSAFYHCSGLSSVTIPNSVSSIGSYSFSGCTGLTTIVSEIEKPFEIDSNVFEGIPSDAELIVPKGTKAAYQTTEGWNKFTKITETTSGIDDPATQYFTFVAKENGSFSFRGTSSNTVDNSVIYYSLDSGASWTALARNVQSPTIQAGKRIMFKGTLTPFYYKVNDGEAISGIGGFSSTGRFDVEGNIMSLLYGDNFIGKTNLTGKDHTFFKLFLDCTGLINAGNLVLPATTLADNCYEGMFLNCTSLTIAPQLPATKLPKCCYEGMFYNCTSLTTAPQLQATSLEISCYSHMFGFCTSLTIAPELPAVVLAEKCYRSMFRGCMSLTKAPQLPATTLTSQCYEYMFVGCASLREITCLATNISANDCTGNWLSDVASTGTFTKSSSMNSWPRGVNGIPTNWTIQNDNGSSTNEFTNNSISYVLDNSALTAEVKSVDNGLRSVNIPESINYNGTEYRVTSLAERSFEGRDDITYLSIPSSITFIGEYAFMDCGNNIKVNIESLEAWCKVKFGNQHSSPLSCAKSFCLNDVEVKSLTIPSGVTSISSYAFYQCRSITSISIPSTVTSIGSSVFEDCTGLTSVSLGNGLTSIGGSAFEDCTSLSAITLPATVTSIALNAFRNCSNLKNVSSEIQTPFAIQDNVFEGIASGATLTVPKGTKAAYQTTEGWNKFTKITESTNGGDGIKVELEALSYSREYGEANPVFDYKINAEEGEQFLWNGSEAYGESWSLRNIDVTTGIGMYNSGDRLRFYATNIGVNAWMTIVIGDTKPYLVDGTFPTDGSSYMEVVLDEEKANQLNSHVSGGKIAFQIQGRSFTLESISRSMSFELNGEPTISCEATVSSPVGTYPIRISKGSITNDNVTYVDGTLTITKAPLTITAKNCSKEQGQENPAFEVTYSGFKNGENESVLTRMPTVSTTATASSPSGTYDIEVSSAEAQNYNFIYNKGVLTVTEKDELAFTIDGTAYQGSKAEKTVMVKSVDTSRTWMEIPASVSYDGITYQVTGIDNDVFKGSSLAALIWNVEAVLPNNAFSNALIGSNFLLYVKSASYAPSSVKNVVVDGTAQTIVFSDDGGQFYCPQVFTACSISYTHNYSMETDIGKAKGWESLALPFDVQKISHNTRGEIVPFPSYNSSSTQKPFWLADFSGSGFRRTAAVLANEPYIIAMPNSSSYRNEYNLAGDVTFSSDNVQVPKTPSFSGTFVPAFATVAKSSSVYALNVNNRNVKYLGSYDAGSRFISGLRDVRPFEAYLTGNFTRGIIEIGFNDDTTDMLDVLLSTDDGQKITIYTLSGQQVVRATQRDFDSVWQQLPKGVYIVNGKKLIK